LLLRLIGGQHCFEPAQAAFTPLEESKVVSSHPLMVNCSRVVRAIIFASLLSLLSAASVSMAHGQFTLAVSPLTPKAGVDPGGSATATIDLEPVGNFDSPVDLSCQVTSGPVTISPPVCTPSPSSQIPPADGPSLTITTSSNTLAGTYQITVTGTSPGATTQTAILYLNVADLTQAYLLSVSPTTAIPSPVPAGSSATSTVTVTALGNYTGNVTLACLSITPIVTAAPYCSFDPATVSVTNGVAQPATLTISTFGAEVNATNRSRPRIFYGLWLAVPGLALVGVGAARNHRKKLVGMVLLVVAALGLLLLPACGTTIGTTALNGRVTPNNTYNFTLTGADQNGAAPSNLPPSPGVATVTLAVTKAN